MSKVTNLFSQEEKKKAEEGGIQVESVDVKILIRSIRAKVTKLARTTEEPKFEIMSVLELTGKIQNLVQEFEILIMDGSQEYREMKMKKGKQRLNEINKRV